MVEHWGWAGDVRSFLSLPRQAWLDALAGHHERLTGSAPSGSQVTAWVAEHDVLTQAFRGVLASEPTATTWGVIAEFELPLEGGRRPDVVVLAGGAIIVLEFKQAPQVTAAALDQVRAYARDLGDYHAASHGVPVHPVLVLPTAAPFDAVYDGVIASSGDGLAQYLDHLSSDGAIGLRDWLNAPYEPLPHLVAAARRIFRHEPLPHVRRAIAAGIPQTVELLAQLCEAAQGDGRRIMAFVTGVPGSGKTLVGLRLVYERSGDRADSTFLSGNGPLVQVLQDALGSRVFVRDLHAFIRTHGINERPASQHILVFDEAQRAWDRNYMETKRNIGKSEPDLLVEIGERLPRWSALVGLVGDGQQIHSGEEGGLQQWRHAAAAPHRTENWKVHCAPRLEAEFAGLDVSTHEQLDLNVTLRSRRAEQLHRWVALLLEGSPALAARLALHMDRAGYPMYLTRSLEEARTYVRARYVHEEEKRYGLLASSHAKLLPRHGVDNSYMATNRILNIPRWYNAPQNDPKSGCALTQPVTEFGCQGLELDLPILCWGEDLRWDGTRWVLKPIRRKYPQQDPEQLLRNTYRVLLTRGRDGLVVFLPPEPSLDQTEVALLAAGVKPLPSTEDLEAAAEAGGGYSA